MVYGLNVKPEHGYYVEVKALDGDLKQVRLVDDTPDGGLNPRGHHFSAGRPVKAEHMPTRLQWLDRRGHAVPDFDNGLVLNVSDRAKALIEQFEPNSHQFLPVEYINTAGELLEHRWFLIVCNRLDSLDHAHTTMILEDGVVWTPAQQLARRSPEQIPAGFDLKIAPKMVFSKSQIGGKHLWCDKHLINGGPFISDELADNLKSGGFSGLRLSDSGLESI